MLPFKRALILAPHTDDGELGCGATINLLIEQGCDVHYVAFSDCKISVPAEFPNDILAKEMRLATAELNIPSENVQLLDFEVRIFASERQRILDEMIRLRNEINPDLVFMPAGNDVHQDHNAITVEAIRAFKYSSLLGYELPWNLIQMKADCLIKLEETHIKAKVRAMSRYKSQSKRSYTGAEYLRSLAITRGVQANSAFAEAFEVIRLIF